MKNFFFFFFFFFLLFTCFSKRCIIETELRCPFRDLVRARANNFISTIAKSGGIWKESDASEFCNKWYGDEVANVTRLGAVWDALKLLPCPLEEASIRNVSCFQIETSNVMPTHPLAKFCYSSYPLQLNIGMTVSTQCCYGSDLRLLVLGTRGAGSVDLSSKLSQHAESDADHFQHDLFPRLACCELSGNCVKFSAVRPASLIPETDAEVRESCRVMSEVYKWEPYQNFPPPYATKAVIDSWAELKLGKNDLIPTARLADIVAQSQIVRKRIQDKVPPYPATTTKETTKAPATSVHHTTEEERETIHSTTKKPASATADDEEPATTKKPTSAAAAETHAPAETHTAAPSKKGKKGSSVDQDIDNAITAVLTGQVDSKKSGSKDSEKGSEHDSKKADDGRKKN